MPDVSVIRLRRTSNEAPVVLGEELGRGGEGAVYRVPSLPELVAKIYFETPTALKAAKLACMARRTPPELLRIAAWPIDLLIDEAGAVRGFLMPLVTSREDAHELYSPKSRRRAFPEADFRFIARAATNVARAFAQLHALGHIIGDVNHGNALIGLDATVMLIDCDSFQVRDGETLHTCDVGVPLFTPPEFQGRVFRGLVRSADHDAFGLAVLLFHLLYLGRHPFAGRYADGEMTIEQAIAESRFVYGAGADAKHMSVPPGTLLLGAFGEPVAALFERAFASPGTNRPSAVEWVEALHLLESELITCPASENHDHPNGVACCWCELEGRTKISAFGKAVFRASPILDPAEIDALWAKIETVRAPPAFFPEGVRYAKAIVAKAIKEKREGMGLFWIGYCFLVWFTSQVITKSSVLEWTFFLLVLAVILSFVQVTRGNLDPSVQEELSRDAELRGSNAQFETALAELANCRQRLLEIHHNPLMHASETAAARRARELATYRESVLLNHASAPELGSNERAALLSFGVETAADVLRHRRQLHHALSYAMVRELIAWAESCAPETMTDMPLDTDELWHSEEAVRREAERLMDHLRGGADRLHSAHHEILSQRAIIRQALPDLEKPP